MEDPRACLGAFPLTWETWDGEKQWTLEVHGFLLRASHSQLQLAPLQGGNGNTFPVGL